jgi:hypothetical protein
MDKPGHMNQLLSRPRRGGFHVSAQEILYPIPARKTRIICLSISRG